MFPEFSYEWLESELDTIEFREADPFHISEENKAVLRKIFPYWKNKTNSDLALSYMAPEAAAAMNTTFLHRVTISITVSDTLQLTTVKL